MPVLDFKGKSVIYSHHLGVPFRSLEVDAKKSLSEKKKKPSLDDNLIIHGDNLHALKALLPRYSGKIKCIYIDPPYNTGNEGWCYNDKVNSPMITEWLKQNGVGIDDLERHDKWLCMMWPRLQLLKELLSDDGVIFISIDDNEQHRLRLIMDEIFGEENFLAQLIIKCNPGGRDYGGIALTHDYVLVYSKQLNVDLNLTLDTNKKFPYRDERGDFELRELRNRNIKFNVKNRPNLVYPFYIDKNTVDKDGLHEISMDRKQDFLKLLPLKSQGVQTVWRWSKDKSKKHLNKNIKAKKKNDGSFMIVEKYRSSYKRERSIFDEKEMRNEHGTAILKSLFSQKSNVIEYPKSPELIKKLINLGSSKDDTILDSFAGSGTTAHAVLDLNKEDNGNRKFILVECEDYADKVTAERVRRVIKGVPIAKDEKLKKGLGGSFTYCAIGNEINEENMIKGKSLPSYKALTNYVYYTATGSTLDQVRENADFYVGKSNKNQAFFVIYKPDLKFLRSQESALNLSRKEQIQKVMKKESVQKAIVFAPVHYFDSADELANDGIIFCQLPFSIYKIAGV